MDSQSLKDKTPRKRAVATKKRDLKMAALYVGGKSQKEIGLIMGLKRNAVCAVLNKKDIKDYINNLTKMLVEEEAGEAYLNYSYAIKSYQSPESDQQLRDHGFKASGEVLRSMGVLESNRVSVNFTNITNQQTNIVSPMLQELIKKHFMIEAPEVIDA
jgi:hypothetical protein